MTLLDSHKLLKELGSGHFATVYEAEQVETGCLVAVKVFNTQRMSGDDADYEIMCMKRARHHKNVIQLIGYDYDEFDFPHAVLELMPKGSLHSLLRRCSSLRGSGFTCPEVRYLARQILEGLEHIHKRALIHRDLKPGNILVSEKLELKISDFGACVHLDPLELEPPSCDIGTVTYTAPEALSGPYVPDTPMDMWSCGCTLAALFIGASLFSNRRDAKGLKVKKGRKKQAKAVEAFLFEGDQDADVRSKLAKLMPQASVLAVDLIARLLSWRPELRPTAHEALHHRFFWDDVDNSNSNANSNANCNSNSSVEEVQKTLMQL